MDVTKRRRCLRGCSVRRAKVESLMNNFTITVWVIWKYFHRSDIFRHWRKCHCACWLLICFWEFETFCSWLNNGSCSETGGNSLTIYHHYEVQRQAGTVIKSWISCWWSLSYIVSYFTCTHTHCVSPVHSSKRKYILTFDPLNPSIIFTVQKTDTYISTGTHTPPLTRADERLARIFSSPSDTRSSLHCL